MAPRPQPPPWRPWSRGSTASNGSGASRHWACWTRGSTRCQIRRRFWVEIIWTVFWMVVRTHGHWNWDKHRSTEFWIESWVGSCSNEGKRVKLSGCDLRKLQVHREHPEAFLDVFWLRGDNFSEHYDWIKREERSNISNSIFYMSLVRGI